MEDDVMKRFLRILSLFVLVASVASCHTKRDYDYSRWYRSDSDEDGRRQMSVLSFNVRYGSAEDDTGDRDWSVRKNAVAAMLTAIHPVLMGCQECERAQRADILSAHPEYSVIYTTTSPKEECEEVAIFYLKDSLTVLESGTFYLTGTPDTPSRLPQSNHYRVCTWGKFKLIRGGQEFFCFDTHLDTHTDAHQTEMDAILAKIKSLNTDNLPVYLTGDLNTDESSTAFTPLKNYGFKSARIEAIVGDSHKTFNDFGKSSGSTLDHCFFKGFYAVQKFTTVRDTYAGVKYISDHYPINIILKFE